MFRDRAPRQDASFTLVALRLAGSLFWDLSSSLWHFLRFLLHPAPVRERMSRLILMPRAPRLLLDEPLEAFPVAPLAGGPETAGFEARPETEAEAVGAGTGVRSLVLLAAASLLIAGCASETNIYRDPTPHPGTSLEKQWEELVWSTEALLRMPDWQDSLKSDLQVLFSIERGQLRETLELWGW